MRYFTVAITLGLAALLGCVRTPPTVPTEEVFDPEPKIDVPEEDLKELARGNNEFAIELFKKVAETEKGNIVLSPYSIRTALAMAYAGARGETKEEMKKVLRFTLPDDRLHAALAKSSVGPNGENAPKIRTANALWLQEGVPLSDEFLKLTQRHYNVGVQTVDFATQRNKAVGRINDWVEEKTEGMIPEFLSLNEVAETCRLVITNCVYFKGGWADPFQPSRTVDVPFHNAGGADVAVPTMHRNTYVRYAVEEGFQLVVLPYAGGTHSMTVILPTAGTHEKFTGRLSLGELTRWLDESEMRSVQLALPKYDCVQKTEQSDVLKKMGLRKSFGIHGDFSGLSPLNAFKLSAVIHQSRVAADEAGTVAAAATALTILEPIESRVPLDPVSLRIDRPFLFFIRDHANQGIVFLGLVRSLEK